MVKQWREEYVERQARLMALQKELDEGAGQAPPLSYKITTTEQHMGDLCEGLLAIDSRYPLQEHERALLCSVQQLLESAAVAGTYWDEDLSYRKAQ